MQNANLAVFVTAPPQYTPPHVAGRMPFGDGLNKRQDLTFFSCGFECFPGDFCQGYRSSFGVCCGTDVTTRTEFNFCAPATNCFDYSVSSISTYSYDSTRSVQYCGSAQPNCATYIWTEDSFTNIFCAGGTTSGVYRFDTTASVDGPSATFVGRTTTTDDDDNTRTTSGRTSAPTASVIQNTRTQDSTTEETGTSTPDVGGAAPNPEDNEESSGLSTGATAGIAVGAAIGGIGLAIGAFFLWRKRGNKKPAADSNQFPPTQPPPPPMAPHSNSYGNQYPPTSPHQQPPYQPPVQGSNEYYNKYPATGQNMTQQQHPQVYHELGGGDVNTPLMAQLPDEPAKGTTQHTPYQENMAMNSPPPTGPPRQELQG